MGEANEIANAYAKWNMELKELEVENKKDRIKDLHPSTKHMLKMASATDSDHIGKLCDAFKSFYNSKNHGAADIQLHQLMEDKGFGDAVFGEGVSMTLWSGNFTCPNPSAPRCSLSFLIQRTRTSRIKSTQSIPDSQHDHERKRRYLEEPRRNKDFIKGRNDGSHRLPRIHLPNEGILSVDRDHHRR